MTVEEETIENLIKKSFNDLVSLLTNNATNEKFFCTLLLY